MGMGVGVGEGFDNTVYGWAPYHHEQDTKGGSRWQGHAVMWPREHGQSKPAGATNDPAAVEPGTTNLQAGYTLAAAAVDTAPWTARTCHRLMGGHRMQKGEVDDHTKYVAVHT